MTLDEVIASACGDVDGDGLGVTVPENWMQGRTVYGGLSAALALAAARRIEPALPLRTAQLTFLGPLAGTVRVRARVLRRGRSAAFVQADVEAADGPGVRAVFLFRSAQPSPAEHRGLAAPAVHPPGAAATLEAVGRPRFASNFTYRESGAVDAPAAFTRWVGTAGDAAVDPAVALLCVGDALPPAALALGHRGGPVSTMAWTVDLLQAEPRTRDGWWLLRSAADVVEDGVCSQAMAIWNADGLPVAAGRQSVAVFT